MDLMGQLHRMNKEEVLKFVQSCYDDKTGGFAPTLHHDPHLLYTLSAIQVTLCFANTGTSMYSNVTVQVLTLYDSVAEIDVEAVVNYVASLQQADGSFAGDKWGLLLSQFTASTLKTLFSLLL